MTTGAGNPNSTLRQVHSRLAPGVYRQLEQEAAARGVSVAACIGDCLREYFAVRVEMASVIADPGRPGEPHTGLIHSILARTEERLAATLDARATELGDALARLEVVLDRLAQLYLVHTPEVAPELHDAAVASANRRYANFRQVVSDGIRVDAVDDGSTSRT